MSEAQVPGPRAAWARALLVLIATALGSVASNATVEEYGSPGLAILGGALVYLVFAHVAGAVRFAFRPWRKRAGSYAQVTYSWGVLITTVVLLLISSVGQRAQEIEQTDTDAAAEVRSEREDQLDAFAPGLTATPSACPGA